METSYEIYPLVQKPLTVSSKSTVWVTLQILWNVSEMRGVCGCPSRSRSKRKLKERSLNLEAAVHSFWQFAPERQLKCSQFVVHVKKINMTLFYSEANCHLTSRRLLSVFMKATRWMSSSSSCQKVLANIPVCERHKQQQDTDFKERRDACMTTRPFLNHTLISKGDLLPFYFLSYCYNDGCSY